MELKPGADLQVEISDGEGQSFEHVTRARSHLDYIELFDRAAHALGLRQPMARQPQPSKPGQPVLQPVLTEPVSPQILYGYGDPCVVRVGSSDYRLIVTSNDAPNAFPILSSTDLVSWRLTGFVFPEGSTPAWALTGPGISDFWAPELHRVGSEWWVCFTARTRDGTLAIGLARGSTPDGPFTPDPEPLVTGDVIDAHILIDGDGGIWLIWKKDDNAVWPGRLLSCLQEYPGLSLDLFVSEEDRRTAALAIALWPWTKALEPMEKFFVLQTMVEAVAADVTGFATRLDQLMERIDSPETRRELHRIADGLRTRIYAQKLSANGRRLEGEATVILRNDLRWEGHLIEGVWVTLEAGRYYLLYAGNDFSTGCYGVGAAVADAPTGPYRKRPEVLLGSTEEWWGPGHPSVATLDDGRRQLFLHAYRAGSAGYKAFRVLLTSPIAFRDGSVVVDGAAVDPP